MGTCRLFLKGLHLYFCKLKQITGASFSGRVYFRFHLWFLYFERIASAAWYFVAVTIDHGRNQDCLGEAQAPWTFLRSLFFLYRHWREGQLVWLPPSLDLHRRVDRQLWIDPCWQIQYCSHQPLLDFCRFFSIHRLPWLWCCLYWPISDQSFLLNSIIQHCSDLKRKEDHQLKV